MNVVFAAVTGSVRHGENIIRMAAGQPWAADDPFVRARPDLFTDAASVLHRTAPARPVEQATKAPGERRAARP